MIDRQLEPTRQPCSLLDADDSGHVENCNNEMLRRQQRDCRRQTNKKSTTRTTGAQIRADQIDHRRTSSSSNTRRDNRQDEEYDDEAREFDDCSSIGCCRLESVGGELACVNSEATRISRLTVDESQDDSDQRQTDSRVNNNKRRSIVTMKPCLSTLALLAAAAILLALEPTPTLVGCSGGGRQQQPPTGAADGQNNSAPLSSEQQFGDLVAIGAISLLEPTQQASGRLVDRIASPAEDDERWLQGNRRAIGSRQQSLPSASSRNNLERIIEFLRAERLTMFCDLLTSRDPEVGQLSEHLNALTEQRKLTLFVPTNEALLLMPSKLLERIKSRPEETRQFLEAHAASELVLPKPPAQASSSWHSDRFQQQELVRSLGKSPLRVSTVTITTAESNGQSPSALQTGANNSRPNFELIVNGASVLSSHSSALLESNNFNAIYAIVHVVDRSLYPAPAGSLMEKLRQVAPKMAQYVELAKDRLVEEALEGKLTLSANLQHQAFSQQQQQPLHTMFAASDDAFKAIPEKLLDQLDSNRTFLVQFLRAHLVEGLYYSAMLANPPPPTRSSQHSGQPGGHRASLVSLSGKELEVEPKSLQSRTWVLVNSIPIIEPDVMTLNGVLHLIARPVFERHLLDECGCASNQTATEATSATSQRAPLRTATGANRRTGSLSNTWLNQVDAGAYPAGSGANVLDAELERDESQMNNQPLSNADSIAGRDAQQQRLKHRLRQQRSGSLIAANNRDFYRPSAAPANLLLTSQQEQQQQQQPKANSQLERQADPTSTSTVRQDLASSQSGGGQQESAQQMPITRNDMNQLLGPPANGTRSLSSFQTTERGDKRIQEESSLLQPAESASSSNRQQVPITLSPIGSSSMYDSGWPGNVNHRQQSSSNSQNDLFEADRYKVLNATTRQRLRDSNQPQVGSSSNNQFVYDRPLVSTTTTTTSASGIAPQQTTSSTTLAPSWPFESVATAAATTGSRRLYSPTLPSNASTANSSSTLTTSSSAPNASTATVPNSNWFSTIPARGADGDQLRASSATNRNHRLLKFQPEDARDPLPSSRINSSGSSAGDAGSRASNLQPAYDIFGASPLSPSPTSKDQRQSLLLSKTLAPQIGSSFGGCTFYDADCKRMVAKLVRLPPIKGQQQQLAGGASRWPSVGAATIAPGPNDTQRTSGGQHLDSTFGETTDPSLQLGGQQHRPPTPPLLPISSNSASQPASTGQAKQLPFGKLESPRDMPFNQPLPPWSEEDHRSGQANWRGASIGADISRIQAQQPGGIGFTTGISRANLSSTTPTNIGSNQGPQQQKQQDQAVSLQMRVPHHQQSQQQPQLKASTAQIVLVPVKILQPEQPGDQPQHGRVANLSAGQAQLFFASPQHSDHQHQQLKAPNSRQQQVSTAFGNSQQQFHTPTPYSVSPMTTHLPPIFQAGPQQHLGRLTNFSAIENNNGLADSQDEPRLEAGHSQVYPNFPSNQKQQHSKSLRVQVEMSQIPRAPSAHRKHRLEQIQIDNNGSLGANFDLNPTSGLKQARKVVRLPAAQQQSIISFDAPSGGQLSKLASSSSVFVEESPNGDISITSARLNSLTGNFSLATQASNQTPTSNTNFVRSISPADQLFASTLKEQTVEFFQNRTIAEIMDDSGLRIDGQQVMFSRLKECLAEAGLLSLVSQPEGSLTIFMPTDLAFQRLVQQQALAHQRYQLQANPSSILTRTTSSTAARLIDPTRRNLIPLVARRLPLASSSLSSSLILGSRSSSDPAIATTLGGSDLAASAADRLSLDCSSSQVRQLLLDHLSARLITPKQLQVDLGISSLSGRRLLLSSVPSKKIVVVDGQPVIAATRAKNGMVYVVNKFLNLTQQVPNVMDLIESQPNLTTFFSYLSLSSFGERLKRETGPITILAPTNEAFDQLSASARQLMNSDPAALRDILRGHIVEGAQFGKLITMRNKLKTMNTDQSIEAKVIKPNVYLLDNQMTSIRLVGTTGNGVVNSIDRLIVPAWLKGSRAVASSSSSPFGEILDTSANAGRNSLLPGLAAQNLPGASTQTVRFETPSPSLFGRQQTSQSPLLGSNSFGFASSANNNRFDRLPSSSGDLTTTTSSNGSPFLRVASNLTGSRPSYSQSFSSSSNSDAGFEVETQPDTFVNSNNNSTSNLTTSATTTTRNMQLIEKLSNLMQAKRFVSFLRRSRVGKSLKQDMNYVILVPIDDAFDKLPRQILDMLERDSEKLADLVNYHVLDTTFEYINTIPDGQTLNTLNEKDILFNWHRNNSILTASGAVVMGGIQEDNIALLIVDRVLFPTPGNILNIVSDAPILSNFTSLIRNAGLEQQLALAGPYTLFAPSDFAFNQLDKRDLEFLGRDKETTRRFLLRHLSQPAVFTSSVALSNMTTAAPLQSGSRLGLSHQDQFMVSAARQLQQVPTMTITNSLGEDLVLRQRQDYYSVNDVNLSYADVAATNGVVHVIDGFL